MQFTAKREEILKALSIISYQVLSKPALPILANLLLEVEGDQLKISATNLELGVVFLLQVKTTKPGKTTLPTRTFTEFITNISEPEIVFKLGNTEMEITTKNSFAKLPTLPADEYPQIPKIENNLVELDAKSLGQTIERLAFAASQDAGRPILTGVLLEFEGKKAKLVATDGYRLSFESFPLNKNVEGESLIIPNKTLTQLTRVISDAKKAQVKILYDGQVNQIGFEVNSTQFVSRLIDGTFPDWQKIIPESFKTQAQVSKSEFAQAVKTASVFAKEAANTVKLIFSKELEVQTQSGLGSSTTKVAAKITGPKLEIAFNWRFLQEALTAIPADEVKIELIESLSPAKFTPVKPDIDFFHIIMPVRI